MTVAITVPGEIQRCTEHHMYVYVHNRVKYKKFCELISRRDYHTFNIELCINQLPFQIQHTALQFVWEHDLFSILIQNPRYETKGEVVESREKFEINCKSEENLNAEQRIAIEYIVKAESAPCPYILFGPAGQYKIN